MPPRATPSEIYQLKITLKGIRPPIWRRVLTPGNITLAKLHAIIQAAMGWSDAHLHQFTIAGIDYGVPDPEYGGDVKSERRARLNQLVAAPKAKFEYWYDFGDDWRHEILVEKILPAESAVRYPVCLTGKRACPPEDCGGIWGYEEFLAAMADPANAQHEELREWIGGDFDPEAFDLAGVNEALTHSR